MHLKGNRFDTCLITIQIVQHFYGKTLTLCPAGIHAVKHARPVTGLCSSCSCIQLDDSICTIIFARQERLDPHGLKCLCKLIQFFLNLWNQRFIVLFIAHLQQCLNIFVLLLQAFIFLFQSIQLSHSCLRLFYLIPVAWSLHFSF